MLENVDSGLNERLKGAEETLQLIKTMRDQGNTANPLFKTMKGMLFVPLYASLEYVLTSCASQYLEALNQDPKDISCYKNNLYPVFMDDSFNRLRNCGNKNVWAARGEIVSTIYSTDPIIADSSVMPGGTLNVNIKVLNDIWDFFCLQGQPLPEGFDSLNIGTLKDNRNAIAHGRRSASDVGSAYEVSNLENRFSDTQKLCFHILQSFIDCLEAKHYLKQPT
ncbi:putative RiboL-PSP-HEPN domain-containing protein [Vibrio crassostreae]|nr:putative RiboL-PSP-HEPN domain-containing protein [Vibrio crassostreae]CAK2375453.1 putative RiboL-PSP-HEPN domain-containing protein [Vibrio crassostreae]